MALSLEDASVHIPRFTWRVESWRSQSRLTNPRRGQGDWNRQPVSKEALRSCVSAHMLGKPYNAPWMITSLTGSLLWALNYAHWLLNRGFGGVEIILVDAWKIPEDGIYPARFLATYLEVPALKVPWHDDPYHEYLAFGDVPSHASWGFNQLYRNEDLHESLDRFLRWTDVFGRSTDAASVTNHDIWAAGVTARKFLRQPDTDAHFQIAMMFLSLRKRDWKREAWIEVQNVFKGKWLQPNTSSFSGYPNFMG
ncbi:hypothetical protein G7046_g7601 [Stylonectria norvegica]|nr:hypothetical protein G7046_g7601 [Stylonectria norvegica]